MDEKQQDTAMLSVRTRFEKSGLSLQELGIRMGYEGELARQSAFQFMKSNDPRISMLRKFAKAMGISLEELVAEGKIKKNPKPKKGPR